MSHLPPRDDLVALVADKNMKFAVRGVLRRHQALRIRPIRADVLDHPRRDAGCYGECEDFLRPFQDMYSYALVVFDREGCGREGLGRVELQREVEERLATAGWSGRNRAIVIDPELEAWVWSDSPRVDDVLGWRGRNPDLRSWLRQERLLEANKAKPADPKEAVLRALREARRKPSSSLFETLANCVSLTRCQDTSFAELRSTLRRWFADA